MEQTVYEYYDNKLGVQARYLMDGRNAAELSVCLIGERGLQHRIKANSVVRLRPQGPGTPMLVEFISLPNNWKRVLITTFGEPEKMLKQSLFQRHYKQSAEALAFFCTHRFKDGTYLKPDKQTEHTINASVLDVVVYFDIKRTEYRKSIGHTTRAKGKIPSVWESICMDTNLFRQHVPHTLPSTERRLRDVLNKYKANGYTSLLHGGQGNNNARVVDDETEKLLNNIFAGQTGKPTATDVHRLYEGFMRGQVEVINNETGELYDLLQFKKLSKATVLAYLAKWENKIGTHAVRSGDRQVYLQQFKPYFSLEQPSVGALISVDDRQPPFTYGDNMRVWFYNGIDLGSECFTCWVYGKTKDGIILEFYRQMVRNYAEWGFNLPYGLEAESSLNASFKDTFLSPGAMFTDVRIEANNARGKRVEMYYRQLRYKYEKEREGWIARPFSLSEANQAGPTKTAVLPYNNIIAGCLQDIENWNNTEHSKIKGKTRWEVFCEMQHKDTRPTNYLGIIPHLGYLTTTSCNVGMVKLQKREFVLGLDGAIAFGDKLINIMTAIEGKTIDVYWLDGNDGLVLKAYAYYKGTMICELIAKPISNRATLDRLKDGDKGEMQRELMSRYVNSVISFGNKQKKTVDRVTVIDHIPKTLNNKFSIAGSKRYEVKETETEVLAGSPDDTFEDDINAIETSFKRNLKDRY